MKYNSLLFLLLFLQPSGLLFGMGPGENSVRTQRDYLGSFGEPKGDLFQVLPNPGNGVFSVLFKSETRGQLMLAVSDATGKYVYLKTIRDFNGELKETVDLSANPKGIYIFEMETESSRESKKVILQ